MARRSQLLHIGAALSVLRIASIADPSPATFPARDWVGGFHSVQLTGTSATLLGVPLDLTESFRPGTAHAPDRIREVAESLEDYSPQLDQDLSERSIADAGNLDLHGLTLEDALIRIDLAAE